MSCIVYITNKKTNTKYAYRSESYRDPITKKPKSRRTYLGRVDPVTNEIIPKAEKGKRNRNLTGNDSTKNEEKQIASSKQVNITELKRQIEFLRIQQDELKSGIAAMDISISKMYSLIHENEIG